MNTEPKLSGDTLKELGADRIGRNQYECPIYGDEVGVILIVDGVAYHTDCFDVMDGMDADFYCTEARAGNLTKWKAV